MRPLLPKKVTARTADLLRLVALLWIIGLLCACPLQPFASQPRSGQSTVPLSLFGPKTGDALLTVTLVDQRPRRIQNLADAASDPDFDAVLFRLSNAAKLKDALVRAIVKNPDGSETYRALFAGLPADTESRYFMSVGLFRNINAPDDPRDAGFGSLDHKVGEGISSGFSLQAGRSTELTITINAVGELLLDSPDVRIDPANPVFVAGQPNAWIDTRVNARKSPLVDLLTVYVLDASSLATLSVTPWARANWPSNDQTATVSVPLPADPGTYRLGVEARAGDRVLSRGFRTFAVEAPASLKVDLFGPPPELLIVAPTGHDTAPGTLEQPLRTIQQALDRAGAGTTIVVRAGIYRERMLRFRRGGAPGHPLSLEAAAGEQVVIDHGLYVPSWQEVAPRTFRGEPLGTDPLLDAPQNTRRVVVANRSLLRVNDLASLGADSFWVDPISGVITLSLSTSETPTSTNTLVLNSSDAYKPGIHLVGDETLGRGASHVVIEGIIDRAADTAILAAPHALWSAPVGDTVIGEDLTLRGCTFTHTWQHALRMEAWNDVQIIDCRLHDNGQINSPRGTSSSWPHAIIGRNADRVLVESCTIHDNHGEGVGPYWGCSDWRIVRNTVYDNWSVNIYLDTDEGSVSVDSNLVYNTGRYSGSARDNPDAIRISNELGDIWGGDLTPALDHISVTNNLVCNTGGGIRSFNYARSPSGNQDGPKSYLSESLIAHNTVIDLSGGDAVWVQRGDRVRIVNNLCYPNPLRLGTAVGPLGWTLENNLLKDGPSLISPALGAVISGSVFGDPLVDRGGTWDPKRFVPATGSPALRQGIPLEQVPWDFFGQLRPKGTSPDIGALLMP